MKITYPIVQVKTSDGLWLHGLHIPAEKKDVLFLHVHGHSSNFYEEDFIENMTLKFVSAGISMLSINNRGTGVYDIYDHKGAATEIFEKCIIDIDAWMEFAISEGYPRVVLAGHSLGGEKVTYYMSKGKHRDRVSALALLAPASANWRNYDEEYKLSNERSARMEKQVADAKKLIDAGKGDELMSREEYGSHMPKTPQSLVNMWGNDTERSKVFPYSSGRLEMFSSIGVPIFVAIGDQKEYMGIHPVQGLELMKKENPLAETHLMRGADHDFEGREDELAGLVLKFIKTI